MPRLINFNNGLRLIFQKNTSAPVVTTQAWINAGSADETASEAGIAHILEHMLFKGTRKYPGEKVAQLVEANGGDINAFTSFDQTVYHITTASSYAAKSIELLSDMVQNPLIAQNSLDSEKEVILEEIKRSLDSPGREITRILFSKAFEGHPYSKPIIGTLSSVKRHSRAAIIHFLKKWYDPSNIVFIVIGNTEEEIAITNIEKCFKCKLITEHKNKTKPFVTRKRTQQKIQKDLRFAFQYKNINEAFIDIAFPVPGINDPRTAFFDVMCAILGQGDTSFLYHDIKFTRQLVNDISVYSYTPKDNGIILISISLNPEKIETSIQEIIKKVVEFKYRLPTDSELEKAKINILSDHIFQKETVDGQARKLGLYYSMSENPLFENIYHASVESCSTQNVLELSKEYITLNKLNAVFLLPEKFKKTDFEHKVITLIKNTFNQTEKLYQNKNSKRKILTEKISSFMQGVEIHTLSSGVKTIIKRTNAVPIVAFRGALLGGIRIEEDNNNGISALMARMLTMGTKKLTATDISHLVESRAGGLAGYSGKNSFGLEGEFLSRHLDESLELFAEVLLQASFPDKEFNNEQKNIIEHIRVLKDNLPTYIFQLFTKHMFPEHPYRLPMLGTVESVQALTTQQLMHINNKLTSSKNLCISLVGDLDVDRTLKKLESLLKDISQHEVQLPQNKTNTPLKESIKKHYEINKEQTHILYGFPGTSIYRKDRYVFDIIQSILSGQGGRLFRELRDKLSLAYSVFATSMEGIDSGYYAVYIACSPEKREIAINKLKLELDKMKDKKVTQKELDGAKKYLIGRQNIGLQRNAAQAFSLAYDELYNLGTGNTAKYSDYISSITSDDILEICNKYFTHDKSVLITLGKSI